MENSIYIAIDLKSFYASVECVDRRLDPLAFNLVVADTTRTERTICLAVSPPLKAFGIPGRPRLVDDRDRGHRQRPDASDHHIVQQPDDVRHGSLDDHRNSKCRNLAQKRPIA